MPTYCQNCKWVFMETKSAPSWRWMCIRHKRISGAGFVTSDKWDSDPPYLYCNQVNGGACELYDEIVITNQPPKEPQNESQ
jgi:hypothetical protein